MTTTNRIVQALAIAGIVIVAGIIFYPVFARAPTFHGRDMCLFKLKQLALASLFYASDYDDRWMPRNQWMDVIVPYHKNRDLEHCPGIEWQFERNKSLYGYAFNSKLSLQKIDDKDPNVPLLYDSMNLARNASDPFISLPSPPRVHREGKKGVNNVGYVDGHARALTK